METTYHNLSKEENRKLMHQILDETVEFYGADPNGRRSVTMYGDSTEACNYVSKDGRRCAYSRLFPEETFFREGYFCDANANVIYAKGKYPGISISFFSQLQFLHDRNIHWDMVNNRIDDKGLVLVKDIKAEIDCGTYDKS